MDVLKGAGRASAMSIAMIFALAGCSESSPPEPTPSPTAESLPIVLQGTVLLPADGIVQLPGTVVIAEGCVALQLDDGETYPVVLAVGSKMIDPETLQLVVDGDLPIGSHLDSSLGHLVSAASIADIVPDAELCVESSQDTIAVLLAGVIPSLVGQW